VMLWRVAQSILFICILEDVSVLKRSHTVRRVTRCEPKHQLTLRARICTVLRHAEVSCLGESCNSTDQLSGLPFGSPTDIANRARRRAVSPRVRLRTLTRPMSPSSRCAVSSVKMASSGDCGKNVDNLWRPIAAAYRIHVGNADDRACPC
jgi:hypothetical protein